MSFYGNSYYYTAETFAKVILKNSGLDVSTLPTGTEFQKGPIEIDALHRKSGIGFDSGNRWIGLEVDGKDSIVKVWHNKPADFGTLTTVGGFETVSTVPSGLTSTTLNFDTCIQVPQITYDAAGHITTPIGCRYFKMPSNPNEDLFGRLSNIDGLDSEGKPIADKECLAKTLDDSVANLTDRMETIDGVNEAGEYDSKGDSVKATLLREMAEMKDDTIEGSLAWEAKQLRSSNEKVESLWNNIMYSTDPLITPLVFRVKSLETLVEEIDNRVKDLET